MLEEDKERWTSYWIFFFQIVVIILNRFIVVDDADSSRCLVAYHRIIMVALCNTAGHYIFALWFLLSSFFRLFSSPNLSRRRLDVYHSSTHGVALVRI